MRVTVKYFGEIAEIMNKNEEVKSIVNSPEAFSELKKQFFSSSTLLNTIEIKIAHNNTIVEQHVELKEGDELSFLPPFAGG